MLKNMIYVDLKNVIHQKTNERNNFVRKYLDIEFDKPGVKLTDENVKKLGKSGITIIDYNRTIFILKQKRFFYSVKNININNGYLNFNSIKKIG